MDPPIPGLLGPLLVLDSYSSSAQGTYVCVCTDAHVCAEAKGQTLMSFLRYHLLFWFLTQSDRRLELAM